MRQLHSYIHEYNFPYHDYLLNNLEVINNIFDKSKESALSQNSYNVALTNSSINNFLQPKLTQIVIENYYVDPPVSYRSIAIYKQNHLECRNISHNHEENGGGIVGVFYINPPLPNEGGELIFSLNSYEDKFILNPQPNKLYLFPSWIYHQPSPQTTTTPRISLNWGYLSRLRPIHKLTADLW